MIPSQWSARTQDFREAEVFAKTNKDRLLARYFHRKEGKTLYRVLKHYYSKNSSFLMVDAARGRKLSESSRQILHGFVVNTFVPFLQSRGVKEFDEITPPLVCRFQNYLLMEKKLLPQSINRQIGGIKAIFSHMFMTGVIQRNIMKDITPLRPTKTRIRGCFSLEDLPGIFKAPWEDRGSFLLCALIYSAGLRNSEIQNLAANDIITKDGVHFLNISKSKTDSGVRIIPIHPKLREALNEWVLENGLSGGDILFAKSAGGRIYKDAKNAHIFMASRLGKDASELEKSNITFYSGRHFYKTMLNFHNLGDIEELFMGHKVNRKVSERYNHKDKRGEKALLAEARKAIEIIDATLFR